MLNLDLHRLKRGMMMMIVTAMKPKNGTLK